ncbi:isopentenyl-diphosphate delta-isomerase [Evansella caseinilytica]|uniref:Isopentenyl-diphosphate delta-isomerase n=1 Tax=Evansella caseinilytica TaxID=1503961 RepID=A0A1H3NBS5_9BACI|nr:type 2 isopentenyl-diphosphate Delta-isomerase [Evansella caseinilytica]SDY86411.1 isopentenyl-diphosphate delta-isomerase [Evansella caseinilytica]
MSRAKRKLDHISHALKTGQKQDTGFGDIRFIHQSLPNTNVDNVSLTAYFGELKVSSPIFINAMTGGGGAVTEKINSQLAELACILDIPLAVGSQMAAIKDPAEKNSYQIVRKKNPRGVIFANIGSEATIDQAKACVDMLEANCLQVHLNVIQELVMPEGDRHFEGALSRVEKIANHVNVPVIVKEVGFGMSMETIKKIVSTGVSIVDIGGFGGTNFSKIENERRLSPYSFFDDWGIPTAISIAEARNAAENITIAASGGIQTALDVAKALALGANVAGLAGKVLQWLTANGLEFTLEKINGMLYELKLILAALGAEDISALQRTPLVIHGNTLSWLKQRGINADDYALRG